MDLQELHERTSISRRKLRYCLDHALVPGISIGKDEVGRPRKFPADVGFGIVCAAKLLELGLPHETIRLFLRGLLEVRYQKPPHELVLATILGRELPARAELGDGVNVRMVVEEPKVDFGWRAPGNPAPLSPTYEPLVLVTLNLGKIYQQILGKTGFGS